MPRRRTQILYRGGYKYQLAAQYSVATGIRPVADIDITFIQLDRTGKLTIAAGYAWDGPSGPVVDRRENMRASLVHDALYQLMRKRKLSARDHKEKADKLFKRMCVEDGIPRSTAHIYYLGLKLGGKPSTDPANQKEVHSAP